MVKKDVNFHIYHYHKLKNVVLVYYQEDGLHVMQKVQQELMY